MSRLLVFAALLTATLACGRPDVVDLCEDLDDEDCASSFHYEDCVADGESIENKGDAAGCEDQVTDYFSCLEDDICTWESSCDLERDRLEGCAGASLFPTR